EQLRAICLWSSFSSYRSLRTSLVLRMDVLLVGNDSSLPEGLAPATMSSAACLWKPSRPKPNSIPGPPENRSASARIPVRLQPGILFGINAESCSASPRNRVRLAPDPHCSPFRPPEYLLAR